MTLTTGTLVHGKDYLILDMVFRFWMNDLAFANMEMHIVENKTSLHSISSMKRREVEYREDHN